MHNDIYLVHDGDAFHRTHPNMLEEEKMVFCGHVHAVWQVRRNMLNVGVDCYHFRPWPWDKAAQYIRERYDYWKEHEAEYDRIIGY